MFTVTSHANSYLRMLMDAVFGSDNFRSEVSVETSTRCAQRHTAKVVG